MALSGSKCACGGEKPGKICTACGGNQLLLYWCDTCRQAVAEKRCPLCGLKARKMREGGLS